MLHIGPVQSAPVPFIGFVLLFLFLCRQLRRDFGQEPLRQFSAFAPMADLRRPGPEFPVQCFHFCFVGRDAVTSVPLWLKII